MALNRDQKQAIIDEVAVVAAKAYSAVGAEYSGMTAEKMTALRAKAREGGVYIRVVKNTLARRAIQGTEFECMQEALTGPLVLAFSTEDPGAAARVIKDFSKDNPKLVTKVVSIGGKLLAASELDRLARLPTKEQAIALLMGVIKAPIEKFVRTMAEPHAKLVRTIAAVRDQKQQAA